jgi:hypothetical protein
MDSRDWKLVKKILIAIPIIIVGIMVLAIFAFLGAIFGEPTSPGKYGSADSAHTVIVVRTEGPLSTDGGHLSHSLAPSQRPRGLA